MTTELSIIKQKKRKHDEISNNSPLFQQNGITQNSLMLFPPPSINPISSLTTKPINGKKISKKDHFKGFSHEQQRMCECLEDLLIESFFQAILIAKGAVTLKDNTERPLDLINVSAIAAGGYIPVVGSYVSGASLLTYVVRAGYKELNEITVRNRLNKINDFINGSHKKAWKIVSETAILVCYIHAEQIEKLDDEGIKQFANFIAETMLNYVLNDCPRPTSLINKIGGAVASCWQIFAKKISPSSVGTDADRY